MWWRSLTATPITCVGVTSMDDQITFPKAEHVFGETEWNFWMQPNHPLASGPGAGTYNGNMKAIALRSRNGFAV